MAGAVYLVAAYGDKIVAWAKRVIGCCPWDEGMEEKVERLLSLHPDAVHLGVCTKEKSGRRCPLIQRVADALSEAGAVIVDGTH